LHASRTQLDAITVATQDLHAYHQCGKGVLLGALRTLPPEEGIRIGDEARLLISMQPRQSALILIDLTGAKITRESVTHAKEVTALDGPYAKRAALVGAESLSNGRTHQAAFSFLVDNKLIRLPGREIDIATCECGDAIFGVNGNRSMERPGRQLEPLPVRPIPALGRVAFTGGVSK
jgi:hypothetical protein